MDHRRVRLHISELPNLPSHPTSGAKNDLTMGLFAKRLSELGAQFGSLRPLAGLLPFLPRLLDECLSHEPLDRRHAGLLLLGLWNPNETWQSGRFDFLQAILVWDEVDRRVFARFMADPFWVGLMARRDNYHR